ncbi:MAG: hypothetical protein IKO19_12745 [Candidatus Riflebacteria bacterium]|nr:hypothetical protein [Candidatus Riflebacteria bacterium]
MLPSNKQANKTIKKHYNVTPSNATAEEIGKICSICGSGILNDESIVICPECHLPYHYDCWKEMGGCGSYGCAAAPDIKKAEYAPSDTYVEGWTSEKKCPECGSMILSDALICRVCKAEFPTEKPMTREEWLNRTYDGKELNSVRIRVVAQFFLSIIGIFTILMLPLNIYTVFGGNWIFKMKRLPQELQILQYCSTFISVLELFIMVSFLMIYYNK